MADQESFFLTLFIIKYHLLPSFATDIEKCKIYFRYNILKRKNIRMMITIPTLQQYYSEILQQHSIYNVLNGHCKVPAIFQKPF